VISCDLFKMADAQEQATNLTDKNFPFYYVLHRFKEDRQQRKCQASEIVLSSNTFTELYESGKLKFTSLLAEVANHENESSDESKPVRELDDICRFVSINVYLIINVLSFFSK